MRRAFHLTRTNTNNGFSTRSLRQIKRKRLDVHFSTLSETTFYKSCKGNRRYEVDPEGAVPLWGSRVASLRLGGRGFGEWGAAQLGVINDAKSSVVAFSAVQTCVFLRLGLDVNQC